VAQACGVDTVAIEATGVYWVPIYEVLEDAGIEAFLFDGRQTRDVSGRKTDVLDCQWSQKLHSHGLLTRAFRPDKEIATLRAYWRQRGGIVECCARQIHLMHKGTRRDETSSSTRRSRTITGVTGMRIPARHRGGPSATSRSRLFAVDVSKATTEEIARALEGTYRQEHMFALAQALEAYDSSSANSRTASQALERHLAQMALRLRYSPPGRLLQATQEPTKL